MSDPCEACLNNQQDEYGSYYCAACPYFEPGDEYKIVRRQN